MVCRWGTYDLFRSLNGMLMMMKTRRKRARVDCIENCMYDKTCYECFLKNWSNLTIVWEGIDIKWWVEFEVEISLLVLSSLGLMRRCRLSLYFYHSLSCVWGWGRRMQPFRSLFQSHTHTETQPSILWLVEISNDDITIPKTERWRTFYTLWLVDDPRHHLILTCHLTHSYFHYPLPIYVPFIAQKRHVLIHDPTSSCIQSQHSHRIQTLIIMSFKLNL